MNDDWDGVDWANHFSGPDDSEIERAQSRSYHASRADESDDTDDGESEDDSSATRSRARSTGCGATRAQRTAGESNDATVRSPAYAAKSQQDSSHVSSELQVLEYCLDSQDDLDCFVKHANRHGARVLTTLQIEPTPDDYEESGEISDFHPYKVIVETPKDMCLDYYRAGNKYDDGEKHQIIDAYLSWVHPEQIAFRHKRTPSAIMSVLTKAGCAFYLRADYKNPDEEFVETDETETQRNGYQTCSALRLSLLTGRCDALPGKPLELDWTNENGLGHFYLRELSNTDQQKVITFVAGAISLDAALEFSQRLNQHYLTYCIARQMDDPVLGLAALDKDVCNLNENLRQTRRDIEYYFHQQALAAIKTPLAIWIHNKAFRYDDPLSSQPEFKKNAKRFFDLYKISSNSRGFEIPDEVLFIVAAICRDYQSIELMAEEGSWLAKWHCHERTRVNAMIYSTDEAYPGSSMVRKDKSDSVSFDQLFQCISGNLPTNWRAAEAFGNRRISQSQLIEKQRCEEHARLVRSIEEGDMNDRINEINNHYDALGYRG